MRTGRDEDALKLLERASEREPKNGTPHHLRGAIFASQGQPQKAIDAMTQALALDPQMIGTRFQLGLLRFTSGDIVAAQSVWQAFDDLEERHPLRLFKTGMLHLAKDQFEDCVAALEQGISLCGIESINKDMRRVIQKVKKVAPAKSPGPAQPSPEANPLHVLLARYGPAPIAESKITDQPVEPNPPVGSSRSR